MSIRSCNSRNLEYEDKRGIDQSENRGNEVMEEWKASLSEDAITKMRAQEAVRC